MTETLLYACKIGEPNYMEEILYHCKGYTNEKDLMQKGKDWAEKNGYDRLRIIKINLLEKPNFLNTLK
jgi:hypothetical protein